MYGLACVYVVFAKGFNHHVQNLFPNVLVDTRSKRAIACPTFVYGLACDYVVFAEGFRHHVQNLFPPCSCRHKPVVFYFIKRNALDNLGLRFSITMSRIYSLVLLQLLQCVFCKKWLYVAALSVKCFREEAPEVLHQVLHACIDLETPEVLHQVLHACLQVRPKRDLFIAVIHGCAAEKNAYVYIKCYLQMLNCIDLSHNILQNKRFMDSVRLGAYGCF